MATYDVFNINVYVGVEWIFDGSQKSKNKR